MQAKRAERILDISIYMEVLMTLPPASRKRSTIYCTLHRLLTISSSREFSPAVKAKVRIKLKLPTTNEKKLQINNTTIKEKHVVRQKRELRRKQLKVDTKKKSRTRRIADKGKHKRTSRIYTIPDHFSQIGIEEQKRDG